MSATPHHSVVLSEATRAHVERTLLSVAFEADLEADLEVDLEADLEVDLEADLEVDSEVDLAVPLSS
jgi:hypothetical protein